LRGRGRPGSLCAARKKDSYFRAQFYRLKARRGPKKAIVAVAASMLKAAFHMLRDGTTYQDLGPDHFDKSAKEQVTKRLVRRLTELGYNVELKPVAADLSLHHHRSHPPAGRF
jgi:transposase